MEKAFGSNPVVRDFNLEVAKGEFISLLGPSGCGKTMVLRMVAGFERPTAGSITIDGLEVTGLQANARNIGMMFQADALFPNLTVADNVAFGLKVKGVAHAEREARVAEMLALIGLSEMAGRFPFQLSALDAKVRVSLRNEIREIQQRLGITTIFVTNAGIADQVGTPFEIYNRPTTRFVANFVGTLNAFAVKVEDAATGRIRLGGAALTLPPGLAAGREMHIALRPEALRLGPRAPVAGETVVMDTFNRADQTPPVPGTQVEISLSGKDAIVLNGSARIPAIFLTSAWPLAEPCLRREYLKKEQIAAGLWFP